MGERTCSSSGCSKEVRARGLCITHYNAAKKGGSLPPLSKPASHSPEPKGKSPLPKIATVATGKTKKIQEKVATTIAFANGVAVAYVPAVREDALSAMEIGLLAIATAEEIQSNKRLLEWYSKIGEGVTGPHAKMGAAVACIALPRLARRGILPEEMVDGLLPVLVAMVLSDPAELLAMGEADAEAAENAYHDHVRPLEGTEGTQPALIPIGEVEEYPEPVRG